MEKPSGSRHERKLSIEEPKTLSEQELKALREAALKVIETHGNVEAEKIFLKGLEPVTAAVKPMGSSERKICGKRTRHN